MTAEITRIGPMSDDERHEHGRQWIARCRAELERAVAAVCEVDRPTVTVTTPHETEADCGDKDQQ